MIIPYKELQEDFLERSKDLSNKKLFIEDELKQIDIFLNHQDSEDYSKTNFSNLTRNNYQPRISKLKEIFNQIKYGWDTFYKAYKNYYYNGNDFEFIPFKKGKDTTQEQLDSFNKQYEQYHFQGIEFSKYVLWLKGLEINPIPKKTFTSLNNDQKLLALHFLGLDLRDFTKDHTSKVLSQILNIGSENIRKNLSVLQAGKNNLRSKENLEKLLELFENKTFDSIQNKINKEIKDLS